MSDQPGMSRLFVGPCGVLAREYCGVRLPLEVLKTPAGFYIGTWGAYGPCSRESEEYWPQQALAEQALSSGNWTQRAEP